MIFTAMRGSLERVDQLRALLHFVHNQPSLSLRRKRSAVAVSSAFSLLSQQASDCALDHT